METMSDPIVDLSSTAPRRLRRRPAPPLRHRLRHRRQGRRRRRPGLVRGATCSNSASRSSGVRRSTGATIWSPADAGRRPGAHPAARPRRHRLPARHGRAAPGDRGRRQAARPRHLRHESRPADRALRPARPRSRRAGGTTGRSPSSSSPTRRSRSAIRSSCSRRGAAPPRGDHPGGGAGEWRHRLRAQGDALVRRRGDRQGGPRRGRAGEGAQRDPGAGPRHRRDLQAERDERGDDRQSRPHRGRREPEHRRRSARGMFDLRAWSDADLAELAAAFERVVATPWVPGVEMTRRSRSAPGQPAMERTPGTIRLEEHADPHRRRRSGFPCAARAPAAAPTSATPAMPARRVWTGWGRSAASTTDRTSTSCAAASCPRTALLAKLMQAIAADEELTMTDRPTDSAALLARLDDDGDRALLGRLSRLRRPGRGQDAPARRVSAAPSTTASSSPWRISTWTPTTTRRSAPRCWPTPATSWRCPIRAPTPCCRASHGRRAATPGCAPPTARSGTAARARGWRRRSTSCGTRLLGPGGARTGVLPAHPRRTAPNTSRSTRRGCSARPGSPRSTVFIERVIDELRAMGVTVAQLGKEYGPGQYEMSVRARRPDPRRRRLFLAQGGGARSGARAGLRRDLHAEALQPLGREQPPRPPQPLGRRRRAGPDRLRPGRDLALARWGAGSSAASWSTSTR